MKLYPYQEEAVQMMYQDEGFLLADEMGLGKTVQALEEVRRRAEEHEDMKVLVVCPKPVISVWEDHIQEILGNRWTVSSVPRLLRGDNAVITNYEQIRINDAYNEIFWDYVICDEAHYIKNRKAKRTRAVKRLRALYRRALTGTPVVNRPDELWSILNWLYPKQFRSYWKFYEHFVRYKVPNPMLGYHVILGPKNVRELQGLLKPFTKRRLKKHVLKELPDKYYTTIKVQMAPAQRKAYEQMKKDALAWIGEHENEPVSAMSVLAQLTRLRQFCTAYAEIDDEGHVKLTEPSTKLDALMHILNDTEAPVVVFTQFRGLLELTEQRLRAAKIPFTTMHGDTPQEERGKNVKLFQEGKVRVFLATVQTGGAGITLHRASTVVFLDRTWSPAVNLQAEDRLHRIGQQNAVQVISIQAEGTVDQVVEKALEKKWSWFKQMLGG